MLLPLVVIEEVSSSDKLQVLSEDNLYDSVIEWAKTHYPNAAERAEVLRNKLIKLIRFPQMSYRKLEALLYDEEIRHFALDLILDAILFKAEPSRSHKRKTYALNENHKRYGRSYIFRPITVLKFDTPVREYRVFWDIKTDQFSTDSRELQFSEDFCLRDQPFRLLAYYRGNEEAIQFFLQLVSQLICRLNFTVDYSFSVRSKPSNNFSEIFKGKVNVDTGNRGCSFNAFRMKGSISVVDNVAYVIDNVIHLQAVLTLC